MKTSRDLMLLAAVAFKNQKFDDAGALFASALSSEDTSQFLDAINGLDNPDAEPLAIESVSTSSGMTLSQIAKSLSSAIQEQVGTASEDEDEDAEDEDDESESDDEESDDESESTSSGKPVSNIQRRSKGEHKLIISGINSPIKLKQ